MTTRALGRMAAAGTLAAGLLLVLPRPVAAPPPSFELQRPDSTDQFEKERRRQEEEAKRERARQEKAARHQRRESLRRLHEDLAKLRESLDALEKKLQETDPDKELSVELRRQGQEVEKLAKRIYKNIKNL